MRSIRASWVVFALLTAAGLSSACSLNPKEDPTRYYVLTNIAEDPALLDSTVQESPPAAGRNDLAHLKVGVRPVSFPSYLKRSRMVTRLTNNELQFMEADRWGEPLGEAFQQALGVNLGVLIGTDAVILHPWYSTEEPQYIVMIDVVRFERDSAGAAHLVAHWELRDSEGSLLASEAFESTEAADPASISTSVQAQSRAVAALSRQIGAAIRKVAS